ncbi:hypothetical protein HMPREF9080_02203 [Cardiobacterium valvarum F0432]|uniref:Uncharacterized protein n=1 Tax=Cardiobacterium valvarum F0432 TaxID=797473 RepID=G9ZHH3_9GAMM|nr:hypothetical protein HMPREF9080_02203 [Cardiobacterium valvarum F0432]
MKSSLLNGLSAKNRIVIKGRNVNTPKSFSGIGKNHASAVNGTFSTSHTSSPNLPRHQPSMALLVASARGLFYPCRFLDTGVL